MILTRLSILANHLNAQLSGDDVEISQVYTDSRERREGGLFVALKGPHFDAHHFLDDVIAQNAAAIVVEKAIESDIPQLIVKDTKLALGELARFNRSKSSARCVAITGSSGKTTVKEMLASIFRNSGCTLATHGNFNNEIGAPLTLLEMSREHEFAVIELGANHPGEIAYTASLTQPDVAVINNVAAAHLEGFGDLQGVARAKGEIYSELKKNGIAVVNNDDEFADFWKKHINNTIFTFSAIGNADLVAKNINMDNEHCPQFDLVFKGLTKRVNVPLAGRHNVNNALAAAACALALNHSLEQVVKGLENTPLVSGRLTMKKLTNGCCVIDDTYNANLDSMKVAIDLLKGYDDERILVIGDMAELGQFGRECHEKIGELATQAGIDKMYSCGILTQFSHARFNGKGEHFTEKKKLIKKLMQEVKSNTTMLVKGSRSAHMEEVVFSLSEDMANQKTSVDSPEGEY